VVDTGARQAACVAERSLCLHQTTLIPSFQRSAQAGFALRSCGGREAFLWGPGGTRRNTNGLRRLHALLLLQDGRMESVAVTEEVRVGNASAAAPDLCVGTELPVVAIDDDTAALLPLWTNGAWAFEANWASQVGHRLGLRFAKRMPQVREEASLFGLHDAVFGGLAKFAVRWVRLRRQESIFGMDRRIRCARAGTV
jgi:hypothetical protein